MMRLADRFESLRAEPSPPKSADPVVPRVDEQEARRIYDASIHRWAIAGAAGGAMALGLLGWAIAAGSLPVAGLGQWGAAGAGVGAFTGAGVGAAAGGLAGALGALFRLPRRPPPG